MTHISRSIYQFFGSLLSQAKFPQEESAMLQNKLMYILVCRIYPHIQDSLLPSQDQTYKMTCKLFLTKPDQAFDTLEELNQNSAQLTDQIANLMKSEAQTMVNDLTQVFSLHSDPSNTQSIQSQFHSLTE